jgi:UPF0755 protein
MDESTPVPDASSPGRSGRRVSLLVALILFVLVASGLAYAANQYRDCKNAPAATGRKVSFDVPDGATGQDVVQSLAEQGLIRCGGFVGNLLLRGTGRANDIQSGTYRLTMGMTLDEILTVLTTPPKEIPTVDVTIPEGLRIRSTYSGERSISSVVAEQLGLSAKRFSQLAESGRSSLAPYLPKGTPTAEGFLFPSTYRIPKKTLSEEVVITTMLDQFRVEATDLHLRAGAAKLGFSPYQIVTIASMIEKEAAVPEDRAKIASVIYNRLDQGMTLGVDATLLYDDPTPDGQLSDADLATNNPYNTRINAGLPPSPIASPGEASLRAALHPADTPYLYYVLCGKDGSHKFARTYDEHLQNVSACLG